MKFRLLLAAVCCFGTAWCGPTSLVAATEKMVLDPSLSQDDMTGWLAYLGARSTYREQHKVRSGAKGEIRPSFNEEVEARQMALMMTSLTGSKPGGYWSAVARVAQAGFMKEYVWTYLRQPDWPESQRPPRLAAFQAWARTNLKNHKAETRGKLVAGGR